MPSSSRICPWQGATSGLVPSGTAYWRRQLPILAAHFPLLEQTLEGKIGHTSIFPCMLAKLSEKGTEGCCVLQLVQCVQISPQVCKEKCGGWQVRLPVWTHHQRCGNFRLGGVEAHDEPTEELRELLKMNRWPHWAFRAGHYVLPLFHCKAV